MQTKIKEHPILFSGEMVRAIQEGRKTQTRRIATKDDSTTDIYWVENDHHMFPEVWKGKKAEPYTGWVKKCGAPLDIPIKCPYGVPGDRLWVREAWRVDHLLDKVKPIDLPKDTRIQWDNEVYERDGGKGRRSIHLPRWASRITLEVTSVRVERVQDISTKDAALEGASLTTFAKNNPFIAGAHNVRLGKEKSNYRDEFRILWDSINEKRGFGWDKNPWVWVIEFKVVK